jgi:hypothetical protein
MRLSVPANLDLCSIVFVLTGRWLVPGLYDRDVTTTWVLCAGLALSFFAVTSPPCVVYKAHLNMVLCQKGFTDHKMTVDRHQYVTSISKSF